MSNAPKDPRLDGHAPAKSEQFLSPTAKVKYLRQRFGSGFAPGWNRGRSLDGLLKQAEFDSIGGIKHISPPKSIRSVKLNAGGFREIPNPIWEHSRSLLALICPAIKCGVR